MNCLPGGLEVPSWTQQRADVAGLSASAVSSVASRCGFGVSRGSRPCIGSGHVELRADAARSDCRDRSMRPVAQDRFVREERAGFVTVDGVE